MATESADPAAEDNAVAASICPREYRRGDPQSRDYGYGPAIDAILSSIGRALPRAD